MTSFKDARNLLLESYNDGIIDDDEFILLYEGNFSKNPEFLYEDYERFDLNAMDETECKAKFRFTKSEIPRLAEARARQAAIEQAAGARLHGVEMPKRLDFTSQKIHHEYLSFKTLAKKVLECYDGLEDIVKVNKC